MPAKGKSKVSDKQRAVIAAGKLAGKTRDQISRETGLAQSTVAHQLVNPRTMMLLLEMKLRSEPELVEMWGMMLVGLKVDLVSDDSDIRRHARTFLLKIFEAGESTPKALAARDARQGDVTFEEALILWAKMGKAATQ